jgi:hypothetical protein
MNTTITTLDDPETRLILHNARAALEAGEITEEQYRDVLDICYHAYLERLAERRDLAPLTVVR